MGAPTVYKSSDTDAPQFVRDSDYATQFQNLMNVLKGCLVNGYGSQSAAGWTVPYEGTDSNGYDTVVFKNSSSTGTGACIMFKRNGYYLEISAAKDITGLDRDATTHIVPITGEPLNYFIDCKNATPGYYSFSLFNRVTDGSTTNWCVIANDRAFYLLFQHDDYTQEPVQVIGFGDTIADIANDYQMFLMLTYSYTSTTAQTFFGPISMKVPGSRYLNVLGHFIAPTCRTTDFTTTTIFNAPIGHTNIDALLLPVMANWPTDIIGYEHAFSKLPGLFTLATNAPTLYAELYNNGADLDYPASADAIAKKLTIGTTDYYVFLWYTDTFFAISTAEGDWN